MKSCEVSTQTFNSCITLKDSCTQTSDDNIAIKSITKVEDEEPLTAESLAKTAESALAKNNVVWDQTTGLYFDYSTNLYYNPKLRLYYNYKDGTWLKYDTETQKYEVHHKVDLEQYRYNGSNSASTAHTKLQESEDAENISDDDEPKYKRLKTDDGIKALSSSKPRNIKKIKNCYGFIKEILTFQSSLSDSEIECFKNLTRRKKLVKKKSIKGKSFSNDITSSNNNYDDKIEEEYIIPCIRAMVVASEVLKVGELFILTCNGATLGSAEDCDILIPHIEGQHVKFSYNTENKHYNLSCVAKSRAPVQVFLNGQVVEKEMKISHKSVLEISGTRIILHVHQGHDTCNDCEPGEVKELIHTSTQYQNPHVIQTQHEKNYQRKNELKNIKKKYGLQRDNYVTKQTNYPSQYQDRSQKRRLLKGSDNPYEKTEVASTETEISESNKGRKMLSKMGWEKGKGLGAKQSGRTDPVNCEGNYQRSGLGYGKN